MEIALTEQYQKKPPWIEVFLECWKPWNAWIIRSGFFCFQKIRHSKVQIVDIIYSHSMEVPAHCWYSGYFRIFGNMPIKILVLVIKVRIIDVSVDRTSIFTSKCIQQDKLTTRTPATTYRWTAMNLLCHRVARLKCTWLHKLYANHYSNRHRLLQIHREIWKLANRH